jgi:glutamate-5-semialdehyde dehydrogenase
MKLKTANLKQMGQWAKEASYSMAKASSLQKNDALMALADLLNQTETRILEANECDKQSARLNGLSEAIIDRLSLSGRISGLVEDVRQIARLPDPIGEEFEKTTLANGLRVSKRRTPIGVLGIIYESRPNVTIDVSALSIKTGNCAILRGGSETLQTNRKLLQVIRQSLQSAQLPLNAIQMISTTDREQVGRLLRLHESVDLIIPRGGAQLHQYCRENSTIPVITGGIGICHLFVDQTADPQRAIDVIFNAKTQRPSVCNALDTLLVHATIAANFIPQVIQSLQKSHVQFRIDQKTLELLQASSYPLDGISQALGADWDTEWLSLVLGIKIVQNEDEAIQHIRQHSSGHSDGILTQNQENAEKFLQEVDSAVVYVNASTRFTDGGQLGLGSEIAVSTQKLHARGPMGLKELTTYKWIVQGDYHVRS